MSKLTPELQKQIQDQLAAVTGMYRNGQVVADTYHKCLVAIAYEYAVADEALRAAAIIQAIPVEYFKDVQPQQMREDPNYCIVAYETAMALVQGGVVHLGPKVLTNQPAASA